ncbi:MAG: alpha-galactosidase [Lachnospiraceae bacterium]|nr:alpha-galactosidase [Lachnospiraceae bacterium]
MEYYAEWRLRGDRYDGGYGNGHTLTGSESVQEMTKVSETADETVYRGKRGQTVTCVHRAVGDVTECFTVLENDTPATVTAELLASVAIRGITADRMHRATSFWSAEGKLLSQDLTELNMEQSWAGHGWRIEHFGQTGSMPVRKWFPFLVLEDSASGHFLGIQLYCASSWQIEVIRNQKEIRIAAGLADRDFGAWWKDIAPGEHFTTPKAVVAEGTSLEEVCDRLVKAQKPGTAAVDADLPVIFNEYCTTWGNPTEELVRRAAAKLDGTGVRYFVIDCGWYRQRDGENWFNSAGDWEESKLLFPHGLKATADVIRSHGMIPGIWYEMENVGVDSAAYADEEHLVKRDGFPVTVGTRRFRDMRQPWVWEDLDRRLIDKLTECGFGYLKVDYNDNIGVGADGAESPGEGLRQCVEKSREYFRHIALSVPGIVIENCASGGHRLEPSMMELVSQASFSDAHECTIIPLVAANLHRLIRPEQSQIWAVLRRDADVDRIRYLLTSAMLGRLCLSGEIFDLDDTQWETAMEGVRFYNRVKHIIRDGFTNVIRTNVTDYSNAVGYQAVLRTLGDEELLVVHTFAGGANPPIEDLLEGRTVVASYGSALDEDLRGAAYLLK